eukprot:COSAG03_NODE_1182_length_4626_cov_87.869229_1_plen_41_part_00
MDVLVILESSAGMSEQILVILRALFRASVCVGVASGAGCL